MANPEILYAEDDDVLRRRLSRSLIAQGYRVTDVENGRLLLDTLSAGTFSLVLTDHEMPGVTGLEALREIRANRQFQSLPVIICSGSHEIYGEVLRLKGHYLDKPCDAVIAAIEAACAARA